MSTSLWSDRISHSLVDGYLPRNRDSRILPVAPFLLHSMWLQWETRFENWDCCSSQFWSNWVFLSLGPVWSAGNYYQFWSQTAGKTVTTATLATCGSWSIFRAVTLNPCCTVYNIQYMSYILWGSVWPAFSCILQKHQTNLWIHSLSCVIWVIAHLVTCYSIHALQLYVKTFYL